MLARPDLFATPDAPAAAVRDVLAGLPTWWRSRAIAHGLSGPWIELEQALPAVARLLGGGVETTLLPDERDAFAVGDDYCGALSGRERLEHGRHYTPQVLADALWAELEALGVPPYGDVFDPACGAGALLVGRLRGEIEKVADDDPQEAIDRLARRFAGRDLDEHAVAVGNVLLAAELLPLWTRLAPNGRLPLPEFLRAGDGLTLPSSEASVVVMNPPYGRVRLGTVERERFAASLYGHANRFGLFLHAAVEQTRPGGLIGAIVPTSFLAGAYYQRLRELLAECAPLARLVFVGDRSGVFASGVLQETCLAVFERARRPAPVRCSVLDPSRDRRRDLGTAQPPAHSSRPFLLPRRPGDAALLRAAARFSCRLSHFGWRASTGPLVWNRHKAQFVDRDDAVPVVWGADVRPDGQVLPHEARDGQRRIVLRDRDAFMALERPAVLVQRTSAPEQSRRLIAGLLDEHTLDAVWGGRIVVENHVNVLTTGHPDGPLGADLLCALLRTEAYDRLLRCVTGSVAVSAFELDALPLPDAETLRDWAQLRGQELEQAVRTALRGTGQPGRV